MSAPVLDTEPIRVVAGDTASWTRSFSDYPASASWALTYAFRLQLGSGKLSITATVVGDGFAATIAAADSALMKPGLWSWAAYVTKTTERYHVGSGTLTVTPNLAAIDYDTDLRTPVKRAYDNAMAAWEGVKLGQTVILNGRTYTQHNLKDLILYVDRCKADYASELAKEQFAATGMNPRHIGVRLTRV
jgi:hypothetical protein